MAGQACVLAKLMKMSLIHSTAEKGLSVELGEEEKREHVPEGGSSLAL